MQHTPPKWALDFLHWFCREDYLEEIEGDLREVFEKESSRSPRGARLFFVWSVLLYLRPQFLKSFRHAIHNPSGMIQHNLLISYRNSRKYKGSFLINLIGLSSGLACALLIYLWVNDELRMDKFHENDKNLYQVLENVDQGGGMITRTSTSGPMGEAMAEELTEVDKAVTLTWVSPYMLTVKDNTIKGDGMYATSDFFNVFSFPLIHGSKENVMKDKNSMVISEKLAVTLFGSAENAVGKSIEWQHKTPHQVSGVFENVPQSSSIRFDFILNLDLFRAENEWITSWGNTAPQTYVITKHGVDINKFNSTMQDFLRKKTEGQAQHRSPFLAKFSDGYLYGRYENGKLAGGRIDYVQMFSVIAIFILIIACINFMNLSTARASRRMKEVGMKKTLGATRSTLIMQYLTESMMVSLLACALSIVLIILVLPQFNIITGKQLTLEPTPFLIVSAALIVTVTGLISGSYPAFYLSRFNPAAVLKGKAQKFFGEVLARRTLVVFQFALSVILIVCVVVVYQQMQFIQKKNLGYNKDNILIIGRTGAFADSSKLLTFVTEARNVPGVLAASTTGHDMTGHNGGTYGVEWEGKDPEDKTEFERMFVNFGMIEMLGVEVKEGRIFSEEFSNERSKIIFNEAAIAFMGMKDPIGKTVKLWGEDKQIVGVVKDFHFESLHERIKPIFFAYAPNNTWNIMMKIESGKEVETLAKVQAMYETMNPGFPFDFKFLDQDYQELYQSEQRVSVLSRYFAGLAVLISCLGLFGLSSFTAEMRVKEIGIRKILGSGIFGIVYLLSMEFTRMVLLAILLALPVSYLIAEQWLQGFAFRIDLTWTLFVGSGLIALVIAWLTIASQTFRASMINPARCLRSE